MPYMTLSATAAALQHTHLQLEEELRERLQPHQVRGDDHCRGVVRSVHVGRRLACANTGTT